MTAESDAPMSPDPLWVRMVMDVADQLWQAGDKRASGDLHEALRRSREAVEVPQRVAVAALIETGRHSGESAKDALVRTAERLAEFDRTRSVPPGNERGES